MNIDIKCNDFKVNDELRALIIKKVSKFESLYSKITNVNVTLHKESLNDKEVQIVVSVKNQTLFCKEKSEEFSNSIDLAVDNMKRQIKKYKNKL